jgi:hypothetical protein
MALEADTVVVVASPLTVTTNVDTAAFPEPSLPTHMTVVAPTGNTLPEAGEHVTAGLLSTTSIAVAANVTTAPLGDVAPAWMLGGVVTTGGTLSTIPMGNPPGV